MTGIDDWSGKTVLIVGGSGGMGRATAQEFADAGANLAIADINIENVPPQFLAIKGDVTKVSDCAEMVSKTVSRFGRLDLLVNAAGVWVEGESSAMSEAQWDRTIDINLKGTFFTCRHAIPELEKTGGQIINIASDAGLMGGAGAAIYCASKGGVVLLTQALALELAPKGVRVNAICPCDVETPMLEFQAQVFGDGDPHAYIAKLRHLPARAASALRKTSGNSGFHLRHSLAAIGPDNRRGAANRLRNHRWKMMVRHLQMTGIWRQLPARLDQPVKKIREMFMITKLLATAALTAMMAASAFAADDKPAIVFDIGGKFDKSFNESMYNGAEKFKAETGIQYGEFEIANEAQREQAIRNFADQGYSPIIAAGFAQAAAVEKVAKEYPDLKFAIVDMFVDLPNVQSVEFKEHEGSYIVGVLAALASKSGKVGFVGGMDIPLISRFGCGYVQGVKAVKADATVFQNMTGDTGAAWNDPVKGGEITKGQMAQGADVVYAAAGGTGLGVLQAAADGGALSIGVDANQNHLHPGKVLTSMLKRVDVAVYNVMKSGKDGTFKPGGSKLGLAEDGVGYAMDDNNKSLVTPEMTAAAEKAKADIVSGAVKVHDYTEDNKCPVE